MSGHTDVLSPPALPDENRPLEPSASAVRPSEEAPCAFPAPTAAPPAVSPLVRFFDGFLQEKNIKWLLSIGALLVLGSSLRLVATHWNDYPPIWKYLVFIAYTGAIFAAGEVSYWRLALRKTGAGMMAFTVLLLPITFLALRWAQPAADLAQGSLAPSPLLAGLLIGNTALAFLAARRIFAHFLRGPQPTFLASYLILCVAGAMLPVVPGGWTPLAGLLLWGALTAGVVKVNRHVFWLVEEHRLPRICGFFPIGLLTAQFVTLAAMHLARFVPEFLPLPWLGLALTLAAVPVLLTADAVAKVFEQRTGGLVRPLPWSVGLPLGVGLPLVVGGVCLAATGMPRPLALPPTALVAAGLLGIVARRTRKTPLVWATLGAIVVAYNFSPLFFQGLARAAVQGGAVAVRESSLPYAFYGLTYLPLLAAFSLGGKWLAKRGGELFARPLRQAAEGLAILLLVAAWGHSKVLFPVGLVMTGVFVSQTLLFRQPRLRALGVAALVTAGLGWPSFAGGVLGRLVTEQAYFLAMAAVSGMLLIPGRQLDSLCRSLVPNRAEASPPVPTVGSFEVCQYSSALVAALSTLALLAWTLGKVLLGGALDGWPFPYAAIACLCGLLLIHAIIRLIPALGELALASPLAFGLVWAAAQGWSLNDVALLACGMGLGLWLLSYLNGIGARSRVIRALARPAYRLSFVGLLTLVAVYFAPRTIAASVFGAEGFPWLMTAAVVAWCFDAARRTRDMALSVIGCAGVLGLVSAGIAAALGVEAGARWYPAAWAGVACLALPATIHARARLKNLALAFGADHAAAIADDPAGAIMLRGRQQVLHGRQAAIEPIYQVAIVVLSITAIGSLVSIGAAARVAGAAAVAGLGLKMICEGQRRSWRTCLILANWQILALTVQCCHPHPDWLWQLTVGQLSACSIPLALGAAVSQLIFSLERFSAGADEEGLAPPHGAAMRGIAFAALGASLLHSRSDLLTIELAMAAASFAALAARQLMVACREASEERVWQAEAIVALAVGYFALLGVIHFGQGWSMIALLGAGVFAWGAGRLASRGRRTAVMTRPFIATGMLLPLGTVALGVARHLYGAPTVWHGMNSLALLLAAGFYFWRAVEQPERRLFVVAATIVNIALALLWRELSWSDPQLFMIPAGASMLLLVELLKREMPDSMLSPLRYLGALVILVSPTFHIVGGSWAHLLTLMVASVAIVLVSIGLRVRALMYTGTAFLVADLAAMVIRGSVDRPNLLWFAGVALGAGVIALAAVAENHREVLLQRVRLLAANIQGWE